MASFRPSSFPALALLGFFLLAVPACKDDEAVVDAGSPTTATSNEPLAEPTTVMVSSVHCGNCVKAIEGIVADRDGIEIGYADLTEQTLELHLPAGIDKTALMRELASKGFPEYIPPRP